jgi:hypothetical protein
MRKGYTITYSVLSGIFGLAGACLSYNFLGRPDTTYEIPLLEGTSRYIQSYQGSTAGEALELVITNLNAVDRTKKIPEVSGLVKEISQINEGIGNSRNPDVYKPIFETESQKIEKIASDNKTNTIANVAGISFDEFALAFAIGAIYNAIKKEEKKKDKK